MTETGNLSQKVQYFYIQTMYFMLSLGSGSSPPTKKKTWFSNRPFLRLGKLEAVSRGSFVEKPPRSPSGRWCGLPAPLTAQRALEGASRGLRG